MKVSTVPIDKAPEGKPNTRATDRLPEAWERYLTGELATMPEGFTGVWEQLELYGVLPQQKRAPARGRQPSRRPEVARPMAAAPGLDWQALRQWLELYCAHLLGLNRALRTLEAYRWELERFFAACAAKGLTPRGLRRLDLLLYLAELAQQGYQAGTRARATVAIRRFFQFLVDGEVLARNPFATVPSPRLERHERRVLSEPEYQRLRQLARQVSSRTCAMVEVLLQTGLRASELCGLRVGDVTFTEPGQPALLLVRQGKGMKDRVVPLPAHAEQAVKAYLATRDAWGPGDPLFVKGEQGRPLTRQGLGSVLARLYARCGIVGASVHTLRHTFATHSLRKGVSLPVVQEVLGHSTLVSTERYLHLLRETMCAEVEQHAL